MVVLIASAAFLATLLGGLFALRFRDKLHLVLGFSAGAVVAVAFFDLLPESISLGGGHYGADTVISVAAIGFLIYLVLDRIVFLHSHAHEEEEHEAEAKHAERGMLAAGSLCFHSFLDGLAIGLAFQASAAVGLVVAAAVLTHDFSDGINTVGLILKGQGEGGRAKALKWLIADALAPVIGAASTLFFSLPEAYLAIILALFAGFFLYIGASDLVPESHHAHPRFMTTAMTILGAGVLYLAVHFASL